MVGWIKTRVLPWAVWVATAAGAAWLWRDVQAEGGAVGFALGVEFSVAPAQLGLVDALAVEAGQRVRAGQVVATLSTAAIDAERRILVAERVRLEATLAATRSDAGRQLEEQRRSLDESVESADRALKTARGERAARAAELRALSSQIETLNRLVAARMLDRRELDALAVQRARLKQEVAGLATLVTELEGQAAAARRRRGALPSGVIEVALRPIDAELALLTRREQLLEVRRGEAVLRAPADGQVAAIHVRPGEVAAAGAPVLTIVGAGPGDDDEVGVCVREAQAGRVQLGEAAVLRPRGVAGPGVPGHVVRLGPQIAELPERCRRNPRLPEWGREVTVALDEHAPLLPGQAFSVAFLGRRSPCAETLVDDVPVATEPPRPPETNIRAVAAVPTRAAAAPEDVGVAATGMESSWRGR